MMSNRHRDVFEEVGALIIQSTEAGTVTTEETIAAWLSSIASSLATLADAAEMSMTPVGAVMTIKEER